MKKIVLFLLIMVIMICMELPANAVSYNVAEGKDVTLNGEFFTGGWCCGDVPANQQDRANTLVDGVFLPQSHQWDQATVWWDAHRPNAVNNYITINLGDTFNIESLIVQADDNDSYILEYWDGDSWELTWDIPVVGGWGMQTRPNKADNNERYILSSIIVTDALRFSGNTGDKYFSVSEIQAYGAPIPEPSTIFLLGFGLTVIMGFRKKFRRN